MLWDKILSRHDLLGLLFGEHRSNAKSLILHLRAEIGVGEVAQEVDKKAIVLLLRYVYSFMIVQQQVATTLFVDNDEPTKGETVKAGQLVDVWNVENFHFLPLISILLGKI